jgi:hypothetical protein
MKFMRFSRNPADLRAFVAIRFPTRTFRGAMLF